uniref:Heparan-alpha-glucosaminide N-acetyltransferase catalytic domain-containing protein n=1 Tax=Oryza meridionalis TaxID=40149 RepID=A0A0E0CLD4_9ORYZ
MGGYELVRSDDAAAAGPPDLELGGSGGGGCSTKAWPPSPPPPPSQGGARQRLVSLDVFRGITVLRIAIAYLLAAICEIWLKGDDDVDCGLDVRCGVRGDTGPACNAVGMLDRTILGIDHLYRRPECSINYPQNGPLPPDAPSWCQAPFDPEGLLSSVMAIVTCLIGLQFGHIIIHFEKHKGRIINWLIPSFSMLALAFSMDFIGIRMNKPLYTISYALATSGTAGLLFAGIYTLVDVYGFRKLTIPMEWMGKHALMIYVLVACNILPIFIHGFYWREPKNNLLKFIGVGA